jgi:nucleoside-diphosphate-sugar epimerase
MLVARGKSRNRNREMRILVTGACGYKGTVLVPKLLSAGHEVTAVDTMWFGNFLENTIYNRQSLTVIKGDVRDPHLLDLSDHGAVIHLASIANDPCGDLNPKLTWEVSVLATMQLAEKALRAGVPRFIYASSGSVYGISEEANVTEDLPLFPLSEYNKTKMCAERVLLSYADKMSIQIVRPATVCGISPRMRLDVSVNLLTMAALDTQKITVFGGKQVRPNIHIDDVTDLYMFLLDRPDLTGVYNAGFENMSILEIAEAVAAVIPADIAVTPSEDPRSYRLSSDKLLATGFKPKKTVANAVSEIILAYQSGSLKREDRFHNLKWMQAQGFA